MKRSDLKKILMEETLKIVALKEAAEKLIVDRKRQKLIGDLKIRARTLEDYGKIYKELAALTGVGDQWEDINAHIQHYKGMVASHEDPKALAQQIFDRQLIQDLAGYIHAFGASESGEAHLEKFVDLAKAEILGAVEGPTAEAPPGETPDKIIYGINSPDNPESLLNILIKAGFVVKGEAGEKTKEPLPWVNNFLKVIAKLAAASNIMLQEVEVEQSLTGRADEPQRKVKSRNVEMLLNWIGTLELDDKAQATLIKALDYWGNLNTVKFEEPPAAAAPPAGSEAEATPEAESEPEEAAEEEAAAEEEGDEEGDGDSGASGSEEESSEEESPAAWLFDDLEKRLPAIRANYLKANQSDQWEEDLNAWFKLASDAGLDIKALPNLGSKKLAQAFTALVQSRNYRKLISKSHKSQLGPSRIQKALFKPKQAAEEQNQWDFELVKNLLKAVKGVPPQSSRLQEHKELNRWKLLAGIK